MEYMYCENNCTRKKFNNNRLILSLFIHIINVHINQKIIEVVIYINILSKEVILLGFQ